VKRRTVALDSVKLASARAAAAVHADLKRGLDDLASIAVTAPLIGFFGTIIIILGSFRGIGGEKSAILIWFAKALPESLAPTALGLVIAVLSFCFYRYLSARLENFDIEMRNASLELVDELGRF
jgi:biopolymer transport protein ExbB/TolQ